MIDFSFQKDFTDFTKAHALNAMLIGITQETKKNSLSSIKKEHDFIFFEHEWRDRKEQIMGFMLGAKSGEKLRGSKCSVSEIPKQIANDFYDKYHIQGKTSSNILKSVGLFYDEKLIGAMSFSKHHRQENEDDLVLSRLCFSSSYKVHGGASKMLIALLRLFPERKVISWSDNRWSKGSVYESMGFYKEDVLPEDYFYIKDGKCLSKQSCQKKKIGAREGQTEYERSKELGMIRIWDCGKTRWVLNKEMVRKYACADDSQESSLEEFF